MVYNKLVRDKIPELIRSQGFEPNIKILDTEQYRIQLERKLDEEVAEFHKDGTLEELADILEVVCALAETLGCDTNALMHAFQAKHAERGGFSQRIFLISKEG